MKKTVAVMRLPQGYSTPEEAATLGGTRGNTQDSICDRVRLYPPPLLYSFIYSIPPGNKIQ